MSTSLYDISIPTYLQILGGLTNVLEKGKEHAAKTGIDLEDLINAKLRDDMRPFTFQVISCWHHSLGAIRGLEAGEFSPPPSKPGIDFEGLQGLVQEATTELGKYSAEDVNAFTDKGLIFKISGKELPFTAEDFILSFSLPNFFFHATTTYDLLRMNGTPLGKMDFLGVVRFNR